jgi:hypothetical protein
VKCDCINDCGDDPWIAQGKCEPCKDYKELQAQRRREEDNALAYRKMVALATAVALWLREESVLTRADYQHMIKRIDNEVK